MDLRYCIHCETNKPVNEFYESKRQGWCKDCCREYAREWGKNHPEERKRYKLKYENTERGKKRKRVWAKTENQKIKYQVLSHYSQGEPACGHCGFKDIRALSIDHINGGGVQHRKSIEKPGLKFYWWLRDENYPNGFQVLCMNCQFIKRFENNEGWSNE